MTRKLLLIPAMILPLAAGGLILRWNTRSGLAVYSDSVTYLWEAHSVQSGHGFSVLGSNAQYSPVTFFPPLYSATLAVASSGRDVMTGARRLNIFLEILTIALAMAFAGSASGASLAAIFAAGMFWATAVDFTVYQSGVLSEGLFMVFAALASWLMLLYVRGQKRLFLIASAAATSAAWMTRYAGAGWILGGAAGVLFLTQGPWRRRLLNTTLFGGAASAANLYWMYRNKKMGASTLGRPFHLTRFWGPNQMKSFAMTFRFWTWQPNADHQTAYAIVYGLALVVFFRTFFWGENGKKDSAASGPSQAARLLLIYGAAYFGLLFFSAVFLQGDIFSDSARLFIPLHWLALLFIVLRLQTLWRPWMGAVCAAVVGLGLWNIPQVARKTPNRMYALPAYRDSPTIAALRRLPADKIIYSNLLFPVEFYVGRPCREIPHPIDNATQRPNPRFEGEMTAMKKAILQEGAVLAYFNKGDAWLVWPRPEEITTKIPLEPLEVYADGTLMRHSGAAGVVQARIHLRDKRLI